MPWWYWGLLIVYLVPAVLVALIGFMSVAGELPDKTPAWRRVLLRVGAFLLFCVVAPLLWPLVILVIGAVMRIRSTAYAREDRDALDALRASRAEPGQSELFTKE